MRATGRETYWRPSSSRTIRYRTGMASVRNVSRLNATALLAALGCAMLAGALAFQHLGDLPPCALCIDQRKAWGAVIVLAALALWAEGRGRIAVTLLLLGLAGVAAFAGAGVAFFHVGVEEKWWQGTAACGGGFDGFASGSVDEMRERLLARPVIRCDEIAWSFLGVSMAGWNGLVSLAAGIGALYVVWRDVRKERRA